MLLKLSAYELRVRRLLRAKFGFDLFACLEMSFIDHTLGASEYYTVEQVGPDSIYSLIITDLEAAIQVLPSSVSANQIGRLQKVQPKHYRQSTIIPK